MMRMRQRTAGLLPQLAPAPAAGHCPPPPRPTAAPLPQVCWDVVCSPLWCSNMTCAAHCIACWRPSVAESNVAVAAAGSGKANPFGKAAGAVNPFGAPTVSKSPGGPGNPFNGAGGQKLFSEYDGRLSPTMEPDEFEEKPWWQQISLGQVVRALDMPTSNACMLTLASKRR